VSSLRNLPFRSSLEQGQWRGVLVWAAIPKVREGNIKLKRRSQFRFHMVDCATVLIYF
jgi:hypothetical protein